MRLCKLSPSGLSDESGKSIGWVSQAGYWTVKVDGKSIEAHRVLWELTYGVIPAGMVIDHINKNSLDNSVENLRIVSQAVNTRNRRMSKANRTGNTGVYYDEKRNRWQASWMEEGVAKSRCFSVLKYGKLAESLAVEARRAAIEKLNLMGYGYSPTHGN